MISDDELLRAIERIALTPDGELLYRFLQRTAQSVLVDPGQDVGALWMNEGGRKFALDLMKRMAKGIDERGRRTDNPGTLDRTEQPVAFAVAKPVDVSRARPSIRDRLAASDPELIAASRGGGGTGS